MRWTRSATLLAALLVLGGAATAPGAPPAELEPLAFLLGEWRPATSSAPAGAAGSDEFVLDLQDRILLRRSYADYPATADRPAVHHEDLMVIYAPGAGGARADYYDNEGHVIHYAVQVPEPNRAVFVSDPAAGQPRFRLSYELDASGLLKGAFEIASPDAPETFKPYLSWESRKAVRPGR